MNLIFTDYAENTLKDRGIEKELVQKTIINNDGVVEGKNGRLIAHKIFEGKLLRVIFEIHEKVYIVITAYYTNPNRYMKNENRF